MMLLRWAVVGAVNFVVVWPCTSLCSRTQTQTGSSSSAIAITDTSLTGCGANISMPQDLIRPPFSVLSPSGAQAPAVVPGTGDGEEVLRLSGTTSDGHSAIATSVGANVTTSFSPASPLLAAEFEARGDAVLVLAVSRIYRNPDPAAPHYEAILSLVLAKFSSSIQKPYNFSTNTGPRVQLSLKLHSDINESWCSIESHNGTAESGAAPEFSEEFQRTGALDNNVLLRLEKRGGFVWGSAYLGAAYGWWGATTSSSSPSPQWIPVPREWENGSSSSSFTPRKVDLSAYDEDNPSRFGRLQLGVYVDPNYVPDLYRIDVQWLSTWIDSDQDGLCDEMEDILSTSPSLVDSDGDGINDWDDLRPLDSSVGAIPFDLFSNLSASSAINCKVVGIEDGEVLIFINNTQNSVAVPGIAILPRLPSCKKCIEVSGEGRTLDVNIGGSFTDPVPVPPLGGRLLRISSSIAHQWDGLVVDVLGVEFNATAAASVRVDLRARVASVNTNTIVGGFSVVMVSGPMGLFSATMISPYILQVNTTSGATCGSGKVTLAVKIASGQNAFINEIQLNVSISKRGAKDSNLLVNPSFNEVSNTTGIVPGWHTNTWNGDFQFSQPLGVGFDGDRCGMLHGQDSGKFGVYQTISLLPGTYTVSAVAASVELVPGQWQGTSSLYISFDGARPDFSPVDDTNGTHNLLSGDNNWRDINATFSVSYPANATVYFFLWGPGWFFLDEVAIQRSECGVTTVDRLSVGEEIRPLKFKIPMTYEDTLLCGFCNNTAYPKFNRSILCQRCLETNLTILRPFPQSASPKVLTTFNSDGSDSFFARDTSQWKLQNRSAILFAGCYMSSNPGILSNDHPADWSRWSYLSITVWNPSSNPVNFNIELRDTATTDYWSRVNWYSVVPPGRSNFTMPIDVEVGEKSQTVSRRKIDSTKLTRLALANGATDMTNLTVFEVQLLPEAPWQYDFPELVKIDVQPRNAPVLHTFAGLYPDTYFGLTKGYGMLPDLVQAQAEDREHPDDLLRDWLSFLTGSISFSVPPGQYGIWFVMEDAGYWEYYQNWKYREVKVSGGSTIVQSTSIGEWWDEYFHHENEEDLPGENAWLKYVRPRYLDRAVFMTGTAPPLIGNASTSNITLTFNCSDTFACTLSTLLLWPMTHNSTATKFLGELETRLQAQYNRNYKQLMPSPRGIRPPLTQSTKAQDRIVLFSPETTEIVEANGQPLESELLQHWKMNLTVAGNHTASRYLCFVDVSTVSITSLELQDVSINDIGDSKGSVSLVRFKQTRVTADGAVWANKPRLLIPAATALPVAMQENVTRCLWIDIRGPKIQAQHVINYSGSVTLNFGSAGVLDVPLLLTQVPVTLPSIAPLWFGYMGSIPLYPEAVWPDVRTRQLAQFGPGLELMASYGFSAATGGVGGPSSANESLADLSFETIAQYMPHSPINSYMGSAIQDFDVRAPDGPNFTAEVTGALINISRYGVEHHWPEFIQTVGDEPQGSEVDDTLAVAAAFNSARQKLPLDSPLGKTFVFTSVLNVSSDYTARLLLRNSSVSYIAINEHSMDAIKLLQENGHQWLLYNSQTRFRAGFYMAMAVHLHGCLGMYTFAFSSVGADPYYALDAREDDICAAFTTSSGDLVPVLGSVQTMREGANDLRFTMLLRKMINNTHAAARFGTDSYTAGMAVLSEIDSIPLGSAFPEWSAAQIIRVRRELEAAIIGLC